MKYHFSMTKKCLCCLFGLAISGIGVALSTRPDLGTSPISSLPYTMTFVYPLSFGMWTVLVNALFVFAQVFVLGKSFKLHQLSQLFAAAVFGFFIDVGMWASAFFMPHNYALRLVEQIAGCAILAAGISFELIADVTYMPGEGLIKAIASRWKMNFGKLKVCFDASLVVLSVALSLAVCGQIHGIREGTFVAVLLVGTFIRHYQKPFRFFKRRLVKA